MSAAYRYAVPQAGVVAVVCTECGKTVGYVRTHAVLKIIEESHQQHCSAVRRGLPERIGPSRMQIAERALGSG